MEKALFDWPIVLQYDVLAKYRLISRKFSGMKFFHPSVRLTSVAKCHEPWVEVVGEKISTDQRNCRSNSIRSTIPMIRGEKINSEQLFPFSESELSHTSYKLQA